MARLSAVIVVLIAFVVVSTQAASLAEKKRSSFMENMLKKLDALEKAKDGDKVNKDEKDSSDEDDPWSDDWKNNVNKNDDDKNWLDYYNQEFEHYWDFYWKDDEGDEKDWGDDEDWDWDDKDWDDEDWDDEDWDDEDWDDEDWDDEDWDDWYRRYHMIFKAMKAKMTNAKLPLKEHLTNLAKLKSLENKLKSLMKKK